MEPDFVIVGGGIGGTVFAALLGRAGRRCVVLEKGSGPPAIPRPEILWPATVSLLAELIPQPDFRDRAMLPLRGLVFARGTRIIAEMTPEMMRRAGVQPTSTDPARTRGQLLRHGSFDVKLGVEASGVLRDGDRIVGVRARETATGREFDVVARYTVGDDGAHSRVREACGIPLALRPFPVDFHCFGIDAWPAALPPAVARVWVNDLRRASRIGGLFVVPFPDGRGAGLVPLRPSALEDLDALHADWRAFSADDPAIAQVTAGRQLPEDFVRVTRQWGHAPRYGCNGAFLLGDAIHPVSPAGGQGANMSVADASALADILLSNHPDPLRAYERRRRPANERSMRFTRLAAAALSAPAIALRIVAPLLLRALARSPQLLPRVLRTASTAFLDSPATR